MSGKNLVKYLSPPWFLLISFFTLLIRDCHTGVVPNVAQIATMERLSTECIDGDNNIVGHKGEYPSTSTSCDLNICHHEDTVRFKVTYNCPSIASHIYDLENCALVNDSSTYPSCCPTISCTTGSLPSTTAAPSSCIDISPVSACDIWKNMTNCETPTDSALTLIYDIQNIYCRLNCGFCTP